MVPRSPFLSPFLRQRIGEISGEFQGGIFEGVRQQLGYLKSLGVGALWLSPVLKMPLGIQTHTMATAFRMFWKSNPGLERNQSFLPWWMKPMHVAWM